MFNPFRYSSYSIVDDLNSVSPGLSRVPLASVVLQAQPDPQVSPDVVAHKDPRAQLEKRADR